MKLESVEFPPAAMPMQAPTASKHHAYTAALVLGAVLLLLVLYGDTVQSMVAIWKRSDTFAHGFLIVPISAWLIWRRRHDLMRVELRPDFRVLLLLSLVGLGWLLGEFAVVGVVQQFALVLMIPLVVWTVMGGQVVRVLAFPFFFLLFAVPFGEFLLPPLMEHTADFTISALRLSGIPVYREGLFFTLPSGSWSVVEACSGLRYLIASVTIGFLYAHLMYRSLARRAIFVAAAVIVPIIANWLRAYMIVMIGHLSSMQHAVGVDHLIYGWMFFGVVMGILFWFASFWREDLDRRFAAPSFAPRAPRTARRRGAIAAAAIAAVVMVSIWPLVVSYLENSGTRLPLRLEVPPQAGGWQPVDNNQTSWTPRFVNPEAQLRQGYTKDSMRAGLYIGYYADQRPGAELITSVNRLVGTIGTGWVNTGEVRRMLRLKDEEIPLIEAHLRGPSIQLLVWRWYRVDGQHTASPSRAKLLQARSRLLGRGDDGAVIVVYTEVDEHREAAVARLQDFVSAMLTGIERSLDHAR